MNMIEDRLTAAFTARAEQVHGEDLAPIAVVVRQRDWRPFAVAAAVLAAAVVSPFLFHAFSTNGDSPAPSGPPSPSTARGPGDKETRLIRGFVADVNGDGRADEIRLSFEEFGGSTVRGFRVDADLSFGGTVSAVGDAGWSPTFIRQEFYLPGAPHDILGIRQKHGDSDKGSFFALGDGRLDRLTVPSEPPLRGGTETVSGKSQTLGYGIFRHRLYSWRVDLDEQGRLVGKGQFWKWALDGIELVGIPTAKCQVQPTDVVC